MHTNKTSDSIKRILWAIDPFAEDLTIQRNTAEAVAALVGQTNAVVEPVAVLSPDQLKVPVDAFTKQNKDYRLEAEKRVATLTKTISLNGLTPPALLVHNHFSLRSSAKTLVDYAIQVGADLIAVGTHARPGVARFFLGSFAESIVQQTAVPIFVVNPKGEKTYPFKEILFPTDFTSACEKAFRKVLPTAKHLNATVILFHKIEYLVSSAVPTFVPEAALMDYVSKDVSEKKKLAEKWAGIATEQGVRTEIIVDDKPGFVPGAIVQIANKRKVGFIAMASHTGPLAAVILGSVAKELVRTATCPVWIEHPSKERS